jgi:hypothetical protein
MRRAAFLALFTLLALGVERPAPAQAAASDIPAFKHDPLFDQETYQKLLDLTIDVPRENNADLKTVLRDLTLATIKANRDDAEIDFRFEPSTSPFDQLRKVSLNSGRASVFAVLHDLSQQAVFDIKIHKNLVIIKPSIVYYFKT